MLTSITKQANAGGTGFQIETPQGLKILSNAHVCQRVGGSYALAHFGDSRQQVVRVERVDDMADLCILSPARGLDALQLSSSRPARGDVIAVLGHSLLEPQTFAKGRVLGDSLVSIPTGYVGLEGCPGPGGFQQIVYCMRLYVATKTTVSIYPGSSGSPAFNGWGRVVGVVFAANSETNHGILVPFEDIERFIAGE